VDHADEVREALELAVGAVLGDHERPAGREQRRGRRSASSGARRELAALAEGGFAAVASDMNWLASMTGLAQGAALLGDRARSAELYERLLPYRGRGVLVGRAALCLGPLDMHLGILAGTLGRVPDAEAHFDAAAGWSERVGARPWAIWTAIHRAELLGTEARAAAAEAERIGFGRAAARARALTQAAAGAGA
jgi:hypothetical protein